jgi:P2-related tail formation protein
MCLSRASKYTVDADVEVSMAELHDIRTCAVLLLPWPQQLKLQM